MFFIISKHTYFLLKVDLHCNLPHFRNVSSTSEMGVIRLTKNGVNHAYFVIKIAVTFEPIMQFWCPLRFRIQRNTYLIYFHTKYWNSDRLGVINKQSRRVRHAYGQRLRLLDWIGLIQYVGQKSLWAHIENKLNVSQVCSFSSLSRIWIFSIHEFGQKIWLDFRGGKCDKRLGRGPRREIYIPASNYAEKTTTPTVFYGGFYRKTPSQSVFLSDLVGKHLYSSLWQGLSAWIRKNLAYRLLNCSKRKVPSTSVFIGLG